MALFGPGGAMIAGIAAAILFFVVPTIEMYRRPAYSRRRHAISMLSLGRDGWIMKATFILSGVLTGICAAGLLERFAGGWAGWIGAALLLLFAAGLVLAGFFDAPAGLGFPEGTPIDQQPVMTRNATIHSIAFMLAFSGLIASTLAFALHFLAGGGAGLGLLALGVGLAMPVLIALGVSERMPPGIGFYWATMLGWLWVAVLAFAALPAR